jgi:hypothetical protein
MCHCTPREVPGWAGLEAFPWSWRAWRDGHGVDVLVPCPEAYRLGHGLHDYMARMRWIYQVRAMGWDSLI